MPAVGNLRRYAQIVKELAHLRRLLDASYRIQASVFSRDGEPADIVDEAERAILDIRMGGDGKDFRPVGEVLEEEITRWQALAEGGNSITGVRSGFDDLDTITGGFQPGNLIILAARPSMGKSALVTNIAENVALDKRDPRPVALFSLEMSEGELAQRFVASQASIKGDDLRKGKVKPELWKRVLNAAGDYDRSKLYIDDSSDIGLLDIRAKARRLHQSFHDQGGLGLIIIDYLQLMRADTRYDSRVQQVGEMSRGLKILARELKVPVIALSQLSRGVESRTDKRPMLSDLRESGQIEQDADLVMFIYRDEYYNREESEDPGVSEIIIAKHRNGGLGDVKLTLPARVPALPQHPARGGMTASLPARHLRRIGLDRGRGGARGAGVPLPPAAHRGPAPALALGRRSPPLPRRLVRPPAGHRDARAAGRRRPALRAPARRAPGPGPRAVVLRRRGDRQDDARDARLLGGAGGRPQRRDLLAPAAARRDP